MKNVGRAAKKKTKRNEAQTLREDNRKLRAAILEALEQCWDGQRPAWVLEKALLKAA